MSNATIHLVEYSNEGFGNIPLPFHSLDEACDCANSVQELANLNGNTKELCYEVIHNGQTHYMTLM